MNHITTLSIEMVTAVSLHKGKLVTDSRKVAELFGKQHQHVMRDIRSIIHDNSGLSDQFVQSNFGLNKRQVEGTKSENRMAEFYELSFNGFVILVMGYTGPKAMAIKEAYIAEFDRMRLELEHLKKSALQKAHHMLEQRNADWPTIKGEYLRSSGISAKIENRHGYGKGKVSRNVRRMVAWGYMDERDFANYKRLHREFGAALKRVQADQRQQHLDL